MLHTNLMWWLPEAWPSDPCADDHCKPPAAILLYIVWVLGETGSNLQVELHSPVYVVAKQLRILRGCFLAVPPSIGCGTRLLFISMFPVASSYWSMVPFWAFMSGFTAVLQQLPCVRRFELIQIQLALTRHHLDVVLASGDSCKANPSLQRHADRHCLWSTKDVDGKASNPIRHWRWSCCSCNRWRFCRHANCSSGSCARQGCRHCLRRRWRSDWLHRRRSDSSWSCWHRQSLRFCQGLQIHCHDKSSFRQR